MRFAVLLGAFVLFLGGYATYVAYLRPAPVFDGATDPAHVAGVKALVAALPAPAGATLDPYGTWCDAAAASCWTSTTQRPKALVSALSQTLVARGAKVRSHECRQPEARPIQAPDGGCFAVLDYHGSRLDVTASSRGKADNVGRTFLRVDSPLVTSTLISARSAALGPWASENPLPAAWTAGVTCTQPTEDGCRVYRQLAAAPPVLALPLAQVCAGVRASMRDRFFFTHDEDRPATTSAHATCHIITHRYRSLGGKDGELVSVSATSVDLASTTLRVIVAADGPRHEGLVFQAGTVPAQAATPKKP
ncbi:MAG: hypothetical protein QOJ11_2608 [Frankiales bacterium]|jgi:hypothetical protein|nr:hypothetical protein [Frankiales bacterium]